MHQWLREKGETAPEPSATGRRMTMGGVEHDMLMPGMLTQEQMTQLDRERGLASDRLSLVRGEQSRIEGLSGTAKSGALASRPRRRLAKRLLRRSA